MGIWSCLPYLGSSEPYSQERLQWRRFHWVHWREWQSAAWGWSLRAWSGLMLENTNNRAKISLYSSMTWNNAIPPTKIECHNFSLLIDPSTSFGIKPVFYKTKFTWYSSIEKNEIPKYTGCISGEQAHEFIHTRWKLSWISNYLYPCFSKLIPTIPW